MTGRSLFRPPGPDPEPSVPALRRWPGLIVWGAAQIVLFLLLFQAYKVVRKTFITRAERVAFDNAEQILSIQGALNSNFELDLQRWVLDRGDLILVFNRFYAHYMVGFYLVAMVLLVLAPDRYRYLRRVFILSMIIALPWYAIYPLAPPRFMEPYGWPFVDTLRVYGPNYFSETGLVSANRYAAMPSMHCGWTMVGGWMIAATLPWRHVGRILSVFVIVFMGLTVIVTGNHYWLDIVGGWAVAFAALLVNCWLPYPLPIRWPWRRRRAPTAIPYPHAEWSVQVYLSCPRLHHHRHPERRRRLSRSAVRRPPKRAWRRRPSPPLADWVDRKIGPDRERDKLALKDP